MNPCDHPHGGGEGKAPIGRAGPVTPWGKPALGLKTRKKNKPSNKLVVRRRRRISKRSRGGRDSRSLYLLFQFLLHNHGTFTEKRTFCSRQPAQEGRKAKY